MEGVRIWMSGRTIQEGTDPTPRRRYATAPADATIWQHPSILQGESRTRLVQGIVIGVVATVVVGFSWGGWVTGTTSKSMTSAAETGGQMSVLVPLCVVQFMAADGAVAKIKMTPYGHDEVIREFVKKVVNTQMDFSFARACAAAVDDALAKTAAKS
jgi:hypothetical protein